MLVELDCPYQSSSSTKLRFLQKDPRILSSEPILRWELVALVEAADLPEWKQAKFTLIFLPFTRSTSASKLESKRTKRKLLYLPLSLSKRMKLLYLAVNAEKGLTLKLSVMNALTSANLVRSRCSLQKNNFLTSILEPSIRNPIGMIFIPSPTNSLIFSSQKQNP